jgi:hypothetical protein
LLTNVCTYQKQYDTDLALLINWNGVWRSLFAPWTIRKNFWPGWKDYPEMVERTASFALSSSRYFLPALYGLLGASIFILRHLSKEVQTLTFRGISEYRSRLPLGALCGFVIGWLINGQGEPAPQVLSFLAGYNVELAFSALDRMVSGLIDHARR